MVMVSKWQTLTRRMKVPSAAAPNIVYWCTTVQCDGALQAVFKSNIVNELNGPTDDSAIRFTLCQHQLAIMLAREDLKASSRPSHHFQIQA